MATRSLLLNASPALWWQSSMAHETTAAKSTFFRHDAAASRVPTPSGIAISQRGSTVCPQQANCCNCTTLLQVQDLPACLAYAGTGKTPQFQAVSLRGSKRQCVSVQAAGPSLQRRVRSASHWLHTAVRLHSRTGCTGLLWQAYRA